MLLVVERSTYMIRAVSERLGRVQRVAYAVM